MKWIETVILRFFLTIQGTVSMPAVTPSSSEWESLLEEAHEPSQEALNSIVDMLNAQKARLLQENHMLSLESEIARLSKENEALRASVEAAYVYPSNVMPMGNPMVLPAPVLMPVEFPPMESTGEAPEESEMSEVRGRAKRVGKVEPRQSKAAPTVEETEGRTTVMLRNLPNNYTRDMLLELIDGLGFKAWPGSCFERFCDLAVNDSSCLVSRKRASIFPMYSILYYFVLIYSHHYGCDMLWLVTMLFSFILIIMAVTC